MPIKILSTWLHLLFLKKTLKKIGMDSEERLQQQLFQAGYNVPKKTVQEFSKFLQTESHSSTQNSTYDKSTSNQISTTKRSKKKKSLKKKKPTTTKTQLSIPADFQQEEDIWLKKIQQLQQKANAIDLQLQICCEICSDEERYSCSPLYYFNYENYKDPYPKIRCCKGGRGYILPPPWRANRRRYPIYKNEVYSRPPDFINELRALERKPRPYVPGNEQRNDDLRFRIREKLRYSHPDFHLY